VVKIENVPALEAWLIKEWMIEAPKFYLDKSVYYPLIKKYFEVS
jgi:hypothetical protein